MLHLSVVLEGILCRKDNVQLGIFNKDKTTLPLPGCTVLSHYENTFLKSNSLEKKNKFKNMVHTSLDGRFCVYTVLFRHLFHRAHS